MHTAFIGKRFNVKKGDAANGVFLLSHLNSTHQNLSEIVHFISESDSVWKCADHKFCPYGLFLCTAASMFYRPSYIMYSYNFKDIFMYK